MRLYCYEKEIPDRDGLVMWMNLRLADLYREMKRDERERRELEEVNEAAELLGLCNLSDDESDIEVEGEMGSHLRS